MNKIIKYIALVSTGEILIFFDISMYAILATQISDYFFSSKSYNYIYIVIVFILGYAIRPLGGILIAHFGDKKGRKVVFINTILLFSLASLLITLTPDYKQIGIISPIIFIFLRIVQGIAMSGESPIAVSFLFEHAPQSKKTFATSFLHVSSYLGFLASLIFCIVIKNGFDLSWKFPFVVCGIIGLFIWFIRKRIFESPAFKNIAKYKQVLAYPIVTLLKTHFKKCLLGILIYLTPAFGAFFVIILPNKYFNLVGYNTHVLITAKLMSIISIVILTAVFAHLIDKLMLDIYLFFSTSCVLIVFSIIPLILLIQSHNILFLLFAYVLFSILASLVLSVELHIIARLFPTSIKCTGVTFVINISTIISMGLIPFSASYIFELFNSLTPISIILMIVMSLSAASGIVLYFKQPNEDEMELKDRLIRKKYNLSDRYYKLTKKEENEFKTNLSQLAEYLAPKKEFSSYKELKNFLKNKSEDPYSFLFKYKFILEGDTGNKYYTYFYKQLILDGHTLKKQT